VKHGKLTRMPRAEQWAQRICAQHAKSVESIIEVGRLLSEAKTALVHGEWTRLFSDDLLPFGKRSADMMIAVADHSVLSNEKHASSLPPSWFTLYQLTKVPSDVLRNALKDGVITSDMPRKAIKLLMPARTPQPARDVNVEPDSFDVDGSLLRIIHAIRTEVASWPSDRSMDVLITHLRHEADRLEAAQEARAS
jgi:hypothetical protein